MWRSSVNLMLYPLQLHTFPIFNLSLLYCDTCFGNANVCFLMPIKLHWISYKLSSYVRACNVCVCARACVAEALYMSHLSKVADVSHSVRGRREGGGGSLVSNAHKEQKGPTLSQHSTLSNASIHSRVASSKLSVWGTTVLHAWGKTSGEFQV